MQTKDQQCGTLRGRLRYLKDHTEWLMQSIPRSRAQLQNATARLDDLKRQLEHVTARTNYLKRLSK